MGAVLLLHVITDYFPKIAHTVMVYSLHMSCLVSLQHTVVCYLVRRCEDACSRTAFHMTPHVA